MASTVSRTSSVTAIPNAEPLPAFEPGAAFAATLRSLYDDHTVRLVENEVGPLEFLEARHQSLDLPPLDGPPTIARVDATFRIARARLAYRAPPAPRESRRSERKLTRLIASLDRAHCRTSFAKPR